VSVYLLFLLHIDGVVVSHFFPAADIGVTASSDATAIVLGTVVPKVVTKMAPTTMAMATMCELHHSMPSTLSSNPHPREGMGEGYKSKGGSHCCGRQW
jgi:hypothetical protein